MNIRIGNDLRIHWDVLRLGLPEDFTGKDIQVRLIGPNGAPAVITVESMSTGVIEVLFEGRHQKRVGDYYLLLVENPQKENMYTIDEAKAFTLVARSSETGGSDTDYITTDTVTLTSNMLLPQDGKSAYELAADGGYTGTQEEWLASLNGTDGKSAYELAKDGGYTGTQEEWLTGLNGTDGKSAYEVAKDNGYTGTEGEWLASLKGADGSNGKSAYEVYCEVETEAGKEPMSKTDWVDKMLAEVVTSRKTNKNEVDVDESSSDATKTVKYVAQSLKDSEKDQARLNINAASEDELLVTEDPDEEIYGTDPELFTTAVRVTEQTWSTNEQAIARTNIGVASEARVIRLEEKMALLDASGITVIGNMENLHTDDKEYVVNAINEVDSHADENALHIGDLTLLKTTDKTDLVAAINEVKDSSNVVLNEELTPNTGMVKTYTLYAGVDSSNNPISVGQIDIPLDKVAISGEVIVADGTEIVGKDSDGNSIRSTAGNKYIVLTFANDLSKVYIDCDLFKYTAKQPDTSIGETKLQVQVAVDQTKREISATIGEDMVTHTELDKITEAELDFTGYNHDYDDSTNADYGKAQLTTTATTLREAVNELDKLQGDETNVPYENTDGTKLTITESLKKLHDEAMHTYVVDALPTIDATIKEEDIYILKETKNDLDNEGNQVMTDTDGDGVKETASTTTYYTPYRLYDGAFVCIYHDHESETSPIDFTTDTHI